MISKPWLPEREITLKDAQQIIEEQFPELLPVRLKFIGAGWDNTAFLVNQKYIFRFPRRAVAVPWLKTEIALLPIIASQLTLKIPYPIFIGKPGANYLWPFVGYESLSGKTAETVNLNNSQRKNNTRILATFLKALHNFPIENLSQAAAKEDDIQRVDLKVRVPKTLNQLRLIEKNRYYPDVSRFVDYLENLKLTQPKFSPCLVHGDLYAKHLLVDGDGIVSGIIDWGDMHIGNKALDFEIVHGFLPVDSHEEFRTEYGEIPDDIWELGFIRAIYAASMLMIYAHDVGDTSLLTETHISFELLSQNPLLNV